MTDRRGVILLLFDIPNKTKEEQRGYRRFRKAILKKGYILIQESVYAKLISNTITAGTEAKELKIIAPKGSSVAVLPLTITEFSKMKCISGAGFDFSTFCDDILWI